MGAQGTATVDFGATPVAEASLVITGETGIIAGSHVEVYIQEDSTADNIALAHKALAVLAKCYADTIVAGTGFTIRLLMLHGLGKGTFKVRWVWN